MISSLYWGLFDIQPVLKGLKNKFVISRVRYSGVLYNESSLYILGFLYTGRLRVYWQFSLKTGNHLVGGGHTGFAVST